MVLVNPVTNTLVTDNEIDSVEGDDTNSGCCGWGHPW